MPPVGKLTTFRYLTSLAAGYRLAINHLDVVTAFLNPHVDDPGLYMGMPTAPMATATAATDCNSGDSNCDCGDCHCGDCHCGDSDCDSGGCDCDYGNGITAGAIVRLNKAPHGLQQAPRLWYKDIDSFLRSLGFTQSHADRNMYIYGVGPLRALLLLYVDDISLAVRAQAVESQGSTVRRATAAARRAAGRRTVQRAAAGTRTVQRAAARTRTVRRTAARTRTQGRGRTRCTHACTGGGDSED